MCHQSVFSVLFYPPECLRNPRAETGHIAERAQEQEQDLGDTSQSKEPGSSEVWTLTGQTFHQLGFPLVCLQMISAFARRGRFLGVKSSCPGTLGLACPVLFFCPSISQRGDLVSACLC